MGSPALSRPHEGYKLDVTKQRLWHRRVLEDTKRLERWNVRMEQCRPSCERITWMCKNAFKSESHPWCTVVSMDVAAFTVDGGAPPVRSKNETDSV